MTPSRAVQLPAGLLNYIAVRASGNIWVHYGHCYLHQATLWTYKNLAERKYFHVWMALNVQPLLQFSLGLQADNIQRRLRSGAISHRKKTETLKIRVHIQSFIPATVGRWMASRTSAVGVNMQLNKRSCVKVSQGKKKNHCCCNLRFEDNLRGLRLWRHKSLRTLLHSLG